MKSDRLRRVVLTLGGPATLGYLVLVAAIFICIDLLLRVFVIGVGSDYAHPGLPFAYTSGSPSRFSDDGIDFVPEALALDIAIYYVLAVLLAWRRDARRRRLPMRRPGPT